jgi:heme oxygenase
MVSFAYDTIARGNPVGLFGMVYVLEGTSVTIARRAAEVIQTRLGLPDRAFSYLHSHGSVDVKHVGDFERLVNRFDDPGDRAAVVHCARVVFKLYGDMFRGLPRAAASDPHVDAKEVA